MCIILCRMASKSVWEQDFEINEQVKRMQDRQERGIM